jgi:hypothetical protein
MTLRTVTASRYVTPLREGGSLPAIIEADDEGMYVLKFRGAGQGPKALVAELLAGQIAHLAGLPVPELVLVNLPEDLARTEPDPEISGLIRASFGLNVALDFLPGAITYDPLIFEVQPQLAAAIVWFDAFVCNVDRTARNVNMLVWHKRLWLIDHGAALYFHHAWKAGEVPAGTPFPLIKDHVLLRFGGDLEQVDAAMKRVLAPDKLASLVADIPDAWLTPEQGFDRDAQRRAYLDFFTARLLGSEVFVKEALRARSSHL